MPRTSRSLNDIAYHILNNVGVHEDKRIPNLDINQIKFALKYYRARFIRQDQQRNFNRYRLFEQDLDLVEVSEYDTAESPTYNSNVDVLRTDERIPTPIRLKESEAITYVGNSNKVGEPFPLIDAHRSIWNNYNKYTNNNTEAFYRDGYVYVRNNTDLDRINIRGIFEDPEEVYNFKGEDENSPFPIPKDMLQRIIQGMLSGELSIMVGAQTNESQ